MSTNIKLQVTPEQSYHSTDEEIDKMLSFNDEECQFTKYGFEKPEFNGEIFKQIRGGTLIGCIYYSKGDVPVVWNSVGICSPKNVGHDLTPTKKPWYETCKFPCLITADYCMPVVVKHYNDGYVYDFRDNKYCVSSWRLLTNDGIEGLKQ